MTLTLAPPRHWLRPISSTSYAIVTHRPVTPKWSTTSRSDGHGMPRSIWDEQDWFWTSQWQKMEREADADRQMGNMEVYDNVDELLEGLGLSGTVTAVEVDGVTTISR